MQRPGIPPEKQPAAPDQAHHRVPQRQVRRVAREAREVGQFAAAAPDVVEARQAVPVGVAVLHDGQPNPVALHTFVAAYATLGREKIDSKSKGSSTFAAADWTGDVQDDFETYGAGCVGSGGVPTILALQPPRIGQPFSAVLLNSPANQFAAAMVGFDIAQYPAAVLELVATLSVALVAVTVGVRLAPGLLPAGGAGDRRVGR
mgnify:CR=1 FL=1